MEKITANAVEKTEEQQRTEQAEKLVSFLERSHAFQYVQGVLSGSEEAPDFNEFREYLVRINGIARDIPTKKRKLDGEHVEISGFVDTVNVPRQEDKDGLLQYAYDAASRIPKEDVKYMLPAVINAVHLFADGNGRTSRTLHVLLRQYPSEAECFAEIRKALSEDGRYDSFDINPGGISGELEHEVLGRHGWKFKESGELATLGPIESGIQSIELPAIDKTTPNGKAARNFLKLYLEDVPYGLTAIHMLMGDSGVEKLSERYGDSKRISPRKMVETLTIDEWSKLTDNFYQLKKEHVEDLVDIFVEPEKHMLPDGSQSIKDYFVSRIENSRQD